MSGGFLSGLTQYFGEFVSYALPVAMAVRKPEQHTPSYCAQSDKTILTSDSLPEMKTDCERPGGFFYDISSLLEIEQRLKRKPNGQVMNSVRADIRLDRANNDALLSILRTSLNPARFHHQAEMKAVFRQICKAGLHKVELRVLDGEKVISTHSAGTIYRDAKMQMSLNQPQASAEIIAFPNLDAA